MRMADKITSARARNSGYLNILANNGELIAAPNKRKSVGSRGPVNSTVISVPVTFPSDLDYPYTFTTICATMEGGEAANGGFSLQVFIKGEKPDVRKMN